MFTAAFFIIAKSWKEPRCPSVVEWIQKIWYIYTVEYYSAIKINDFMKFLGKWMDLENIILSEATQSQKNTHGIYSLISGYQPKSSEYARYNSQTTRSSRRSKTKVQVLWFFSERGTKYSQEQIWRQSAEQRLKEIHLETLLLGDSSRFSHQTLTLLSMLTNAC